MKNRVSVYFILIILIVTNRFVYADAQSVTNIKGVVVGSCSLDFPGNVVMQDIPLKLLDETGVGKLLPEKYSEMFELRVNCTSTYYTVYFIATESTFINSCITGANNHQFLIFCLKRDSNIDLSFNTNNSISLEHGSIDYGKAYASFTKSSQETVTLININVGRGSGGIEAGKYMTPLTIVIQPI